jgi:outer membrane protein assembly factor BamB
MKDPSFSRRKLLAGASAAGIAAAAGGVLLGGPSRQAVLAQDAVGTPVALGDAIPPEFTVDTNWPVENYNLAGTRAPAGATIDSSNVATLGVAWTYEVVTTAAAFFGSLTSNPIVSGNTLVVQDATANVIALALDSGAELWRHDVNQVVPSGGPNGVAAAYGFVFTTEGGTADVVALNAEDGSEVWRTNIRGPLNEGITTAPLVYNSVVYVSTIPGDQESFYGGGQRGVIHALDAKTGGVLWYFDTTTDNLWGNPRVNSGGGFWHPPSIDEDGNLYVGIGNAAPYPGTPDWPAGTSRPGPNDYANNILKFDPVTGTLTWSYNVKPHDIFDLDNQLTPILIDLEDGRKIVVTSGKHGIVVALDRDTGEVVWRTPVGTHKNDDATTIPDGGFLEVWPGTLGGVETPMAYANGMVFAPVYELPSFYAPGGFDPDHPFDFTTATGVIVALNATDGSVAWQVEIPTGPLAGITVTNDVLFSAGLDGAILGLSTADGSELFRFQAPAGINASSAASGDTVIFAAGGPLIPSANTVNPPETPTPTVFALRVGAGGTATPTA